MSETIKIGVIAQSEFPKQLEPLVGGIFRAQFQKLLDILGTDFFELYGSIGDRVSELACSCAAEAGAKLILAPRSSLFEFGEAKDEIAEKVHEILLRQPNTVLSENKLSELGLLNLCDVLFLVYDKDDSAEASRFAEIKKCLFGLGEGRGITEELSIEVNLPKIWTPDSDGEVYFDYIFRGPGKDELSSEIEIPMKIIDSWASQITSKRHWQIGGYATSRQCQRGLLTEAPFNRRGM
jgi:hypothetical protein